MQEVQSEGEVWDELGARDEEEEEDGAAGGLEGVVSFFLICGRMGMGTGRKGEWRRGGGW